MPTYRCTVSIEYAFEQDNGLPRAVSFDPARPDSAADVHIYGQLDIHLRSGPNTFEPLIWDVADSLDAMLMDLAGDFRSCCTDPQQTRKSNQRDFSMRREGNRLVLLQNEWFNHTTQKWMREPQDLRVFSIDLREFAAELFAAGRRYHADVTGGIVKCGPAAMARFKAFMDEIEPRVLEAVRSIGSQS